MRFNRFLLAGAATALTYATFTFIARESIAQDDFSMGFFITSSGPGNGADLGGLAGADAHCQTLAAAVGSGDRTWRAYLSAQAKDDQIAVNARDRIGAGPWHNAVGVIVANNVDELHGENNLSKETALNEKGEIVNGRGDSPNRHDILTGSQLDGTVVPGEGDSTCSNWTSSGDGSALVGHHDRQGGGDNPTSWNSAHGSRGCSQSNLRSTGGDGLFYCFAADLSPLALAPLDDGTISDPTERSNYVHDVLGTWFGDSNLDGEFNSSDLVALFQVGEYEDAIEANSSWVTGDWSGDGEFDSSDLVLAFQDGGFELGPRTAVAAVPEPSSAIILAIGVIGVCRFRQSQ
jgi:hypothetical protein